MSSSDGWAELPLSHLIEPLQSGSRPKGGVRQITVGVPSLGGEHLTDRGTFDFTRAKYVPREFFDSMRRGRIHTGDVLLVKDGATTGKVAIVRDDFPFEEAVVNEHVFICRPREDIVPEYLFWFLYSSEGQRRILEHFKGSAQGGINQAFATRTHVPLAPYDEQRELAQLFEAVSSKQRSASAHVATARRAIERFQRAVLSAASGGRLTADWRASRGVIDEKDVSGDWMRTTVDGVADCLDRKRKPINAAERAQRSGDVPYYGANGQVGWINEPLFNEPLVLVVEDETFTGRTKPFSYIVTGPSWVNNHAHVLRARESISTEMLNILLAYYDFVPLTSGTTGRRKLNQTALMSAPLPLPPPQEQEEIVRRVNQLLALAVGLKERIEAASQGVDSSSQAVLAKAFRGELVGPRI
jgi:restriction endonuclease S subunit